MFCQDGQIAAIAVAASLMLTTRNTADFVGFTLDGGAVRTPAAAPGATSMPCAQPGAPHLTRDDRLGGCLPFAHVDQQQQQAAQDEKA